MKKIIPIVLSAVIMTLGSNAALAQKPGGEHQRLSREQLAEKQAQHIASDLALDDVTTQKFVTAFSNYQKEVWALGPRKGHDDHKQPVTEAEAEKEIKAGFERSKKMLDLREKYYKEYSKFLTQKQILRVYELEKQSMRRFAKHRRDGNHGDGPRGEGPRCDNPRGDGPRGQYGPRR